MSALMYLDSNPWLALCLLGIFSLLLGSFFNVVIYRLPKMMEAHWKHECQLILEQEPTSPPESFNLALPNSHCPQCGAAVKAWQNIPVLSFILLRGRCASCQNKIGLRYPAVELATAALAVFTALQFGFTWQALAVILFSWLLLIMSVIDIDPVSYTHLTLPTICSV